MGWRFTNIIFLSLFVLVFFPQIARAACGDSITGGAGTSGDPYQIDDAVELAAISNCLGSGNSSKYFKVMNDIDLDVSPYNTGSGWTPIGSSGSQFYGTFDGDSNTISNLFISRTSTDYVGLFGYNRGTIKNIVLTDASVLANQLSGVLVGYNTGNVASSSASGTFSGSNWSGGLVGSNSSTGKIWGSASYVDVTGKSGAQVIGSLAGENYSGGVIVNPYAHGSVSSLSAYAGGVAGSNYTSTAYNTYSTGAITSTSGTGIGGLFGGSTNGTISGSYWDTETSGKSTTVGSGTGRTTAQMKDESTYSGWDFTNIWAIDSGVNDGYPYLQWQDFTPPDTTEPTLSSISVSTTTNSATITWTTDESASSLVRFGPITNFGSTTAEINTSPRVTSHSVSLSELASCVQYFYEARSTDAASNTGVSDRKSFWTAGCTGDATVASTTVDNITTSTGGTLAQTGITLTVPTSFTNATSSAIFQANKLDADSFFDTASTPTGKNRVGDNVFNLKAMSDATTTISSFEVAITVALEYEDDDVSSLDESTLEIHRYDEGDWHALSNCVVDEDINTVTCETSNFSDFAIFGEELADSGSSDNSGGGSGSLRGTSMKRRVENLISMGNTELAAALSTTLSPAPVTATFDHKIFTRDLFLKDLGDDVEALQRFLIDQNKGPAALELARVGATGYFGRYTQAALAEFQLSVGVTPSSGYFGPKTKSYLTK